MSEAFTVGDLRRELDKIPDDHVLHFDGGVTFSRLKRCGDEEWVLIFGELQAELSNVFRKKHPRVKVAFCESTPPDDPNAVVWMDTIPRL